MEEATGLRRERRKSGGGAEGWLGRVDLGSLAHNYLHTLSGGQRKRGVLPKC